MNFTGYEMYFNTAVHLGKGKLEDAECVIYADTLFSAMCHEALHMGGQECLDKLVTLVEENKIRISDTFPVHSDSNEKEYYIPKPMLSPQIDKKGDSSVKKELKKLGHIPWSRLHQYLAGEMNVRREAEKYHNMGKNEIRIMASVKEGEDTVPFPVGAFRFNHGWGLYLLIGYESEDSLEFVEALLEGISYAGIGGKRSAGMGKFTLHKARILDMLLADVCVEKEGKGTYMSLSVSLPQDDKLDNIVQGAKYGIIRRSGFISSQTYANRQVKKREIYLFRSGSVFCNTFEGGLRDVSGDGQHPVYRYAKPIFLEVK